MSLKIRLLTVLQLAAFLAGAVAPSIASAAPDKASLTAKQRRTIQVRNQRLKGLDSVIRQTVTMPGQVGESARAAIRDRASVLFNQNTPIDVTVTQQRLAIGALFKDENSRNLLVSTAVSEITALSNSLKAKLLNPAVTRGQAFRVDELVVGMGPHGATYVQEKTTSDPNRAVLIVESTTKPGGTFADVGNAFALNSTSRKYDGERASPGKGDLNNIHDIVGIPDFKGSRWAEAGSLGEITTMGVYLSGALPLVQTEVVALAFNPRGGQPNEPKYKVTMQDKISGTKFSVLTDKIIFSTGLGVAKDSFTDAESKKVEKMERMSAERAGVAPRIEPFTAFIERAGDIENRNPLRALVDKSVAVVGFGDSGRVAIELLIGIGPEAAYKADVAQVGRPKTIYWYVGENGPKNCDEYLKGSQTLKGSRSRYARIAQAINSGQVVLVPGRLEGITISNNGQIMPDRQTLKRLETRKLLSGEIRIVDAGSIKNTNGVINYIQPKDPRTGQPQTVVEKVVGFDKVLTTTGFDSQLPKLIAGLTATPFKEAFKTLRRTPTAFNGKEVNVANELKDHPGVFLIGPSNELLGGLPEKGELAGVNENTVSLFINVERDKDLSRFLSETPSTNYANEIAPITNAVISETLGAAALPIKSGSSSKLYIQPDQSKFKDVRRVPNTELALRASLDGVLKRFVLDSQGELKVTIRYSQIGNESGYLLDLGKYAVNQQSAEVLERIFAKDAQLNSVLLRDYFKKGSLVKAIDVTVPITAAGRLDMAKMEVMPLRR